MAICCTVGIVRVAPLSICTDETVSMCPVMTDDWILHCLYVGRYYWTYTYIRVRVHEVQYGCRQATLLKSHVSPGSHLLCAW